MVHLKLVLSVNYHQSMKKKSCRGCFWPHTPQQPCHQTAISKSAQVNCHLDYMVPIHFHLSHILYLPQQNYICYFFYTSTVCANYLFYVRYVLLLSLALLSSLQFDILSYKFLLLSLECVPLIILYYMLNARAKWVPIISAVLVFKTFFFYGNQ